MTNPEEPRVPWYIDMNARHRPRTMRLLAYMALAGREGVLNAGDLRVSAATTPGASIRIAPGAFGVLNTAVGGAYEAYVDKLEEQLTRQVTPTDASAGGRTDLVILRIKNPHAVGTGTYPIPEPPQDGPYWDVDVITGVQPNITSVRAHDPSWSAITLARITRPPNTGIVQQSHITDLRSLVDLSGERIIIIDNPPPDPPPVAQAYWTESTPCNRPDVTLKPDQFDWKHFPNNAEWMVPIPSWATGFDLNCLLNPQITGSVWGEARLVIDNGSITNDACGIIPAEYDFNYKGGPGPERTVVMVGGTGNLQKAHRGKVVRMRLQFRSVADDWQSAHPGHLAQERGTRVNIWINFKKHPSYDP